MFAVNFKYDCLNRCILLPQIRIVLEEESAILLKIIYNRKCIHQILILGLQMYTYKLPW